ncbi:MAG: M20 aminoacylase family protein [Pseudomonadota bacterium]
MAILNSVADGLGDVRAWRRHLHANPELMFDVHETAKFVAEKLREFGCDEVVTGIGRTGVVGLINGNRGSGPTIGLRSDMDALPITERRDLPHKSKTSGKMHACGHDGHMAMLLGAARHFAETRNFSGRIAVIFQPAEEGGGGGRVMVEDGLMGRFDIERVYGMHNMPGIPVGEFAIRKGPFFAATDEFAITIIGKGGHAAMPHRANDPVVIGAQIVQAFQTIASRSVDPLASIVVSVTKFNAGTAHNVIPERVTLAGTMRTLTPENRAFGEKRMREIVDGVVAAYGARAEFGFHRGYPVTVNDGDEALICADAAQTVTDAIHVNSEAEPLMGGEDFAYMLEAKPGAMILIGNGDTAGLHHPDYDFNDDALGWGVSYWVKLAETQLAA